MPTLLDLYCGAGGASVGYARAGFDVVGVDITPQPNYPFEFIEADAIEFVRGFGVGFDVIHASPPCQAYSNAQRIRDRHHPDLIAATREELIVCDRPYVIENVVGAPLISPVLLCGASFSLGTYRHRLFESAEALFEPAHLDHVAPMTKMGRPPQSGAMMHIVGNFSGVERARAAMGIDWMTRDELREAIPPAYTELIGAALLTTLRVAA